MSALSLTDLINQRQTLIVDPKAIHPLPPPLANPELAAPEGALEPGDRKKKLVGQWVKVNGQLICQWTLQ